MLRPSGRYHLLTRPAVARLVLPADTGTTLSFKASTDAITRMGCDTSSVISLDASTDLTA